jgi:hypothetical protein
MVLRWLTVIHKEKDITLDVIYFLIQGTVLIMHHLFFNSKQLFICFR